MQKVDCLATIVLTLAMLFTVSGAAQDRDKAMEAKRLLKEAVVFDQNNQFIDADTSLLVQAIALSEAHQLSDLLVEAHRRMGDYYSLNAKYPRAIHHFQTALKATNTLADPAEEIYLLTMRTANSYELLGRREEAQELYLNLLAATDQKLKQEQADSTNLRYDKSRILINLGNTYSWQGEFEKAIPTMQMAYDLVKKEDYSNYARYLFLKTDMAFHLGSVYLFKGDGQAAKPYILEHLTYVEEQNQDFKALAQSYGNLAYCEYLLRDFESAYHYYFKKSGHLRKI